MFIVRLIAVRVVTILDAVFVILAAVSSWLEIPFSIAECRRDCDVQRIVLHFWLSIMCVRKLGHC